MKDTPYYLPVAVYPFKENSTIFYLSSKGCKQNAILTLLDHQIMTTRSPSMYFRIPPHPETIWRKYFKYFYVFRWICAVFQLRTFFIQNCLPSGWFFLANFMSDHILFMIMYYIYMTKTARYEKRCTGDLGHLPKALLLWLPTELSCNKPIRSYTLFCFWGWWWCQAELHNLQFIIISRLSQNFILETHRLCFLRHLLQKCSKSRFLEENSCF